MKYTKGPWQATGVSVRAGGIRIRQSGYRGGASVQAEKSYNEMLKANAKLIAMAPEMLDELQNALGWMKKQREWYLDPVETDLEYSIRKLIQKAIDDE